MANDEVQRIDVGATRLAYRVHGSGPALVLVHGYPMHGETWRKLVPELARQFTCYTPDLPGLGLSDWDAATTDFGFHGHARTLRGFVDALRLDAYALVAQDTGGTVARCLADADGARVSRLVLINTEMPGHRPPWIPLYRHLAALPGAWLSFRLLLAQRWFRRSPMGLGGLFVDKDLLDGDFHARFVAPLLASTRRMQGSLRYLHGIGWDVVDSMREVHARLPMPVQLIWGVEDPTFPVAIARTMAEQFRTPPDFVEVPRAALMPHEEQPELVLRALVPFLTAERHQLRRVH